LVPLLGIDRKVECKVRADGFAQIYRWIDGNFAFVIKRDRDTPLVVTRLIDGLEVAKVAEAKPPRVRWCRRKAAPLSRERVPGFRRYPTGGDTPKFPWREDRDGIVPQGQRRRRASRGVAPRSPDMASGSQHMTMRAINHPRADFLRKTSKC
jgi:hypothetical protein